MKNHKNTINPMALASGTSMMAGVFKSQGFDNVAAALTTSTRSDVPATVTYSGSDLLSKDIWAYSPEFKSKVVSFLNEAKSLKKTEYFKTTTMAFAMQSESKSQILANTTLKKRTDLFGTLNKVTMNALPFGVSQW